MASKNLYKSLKGAAGVHLVVAQLSLRGFIALPTTRNLKAVDVVAFKEDYRNAVFLQVKSTDKPKQGWPVHTTPRKAENWQKALTDAIRSDGNLYYIFVDLSKGAGGGSSFYIVPAKDVLKHLKDGVEEYLRKHPGIKAQGQLWTWPGSPSLERMDEYKNENGWELLEH